MSILSSLEGRIDRALSRLFGRRAEQGIHPVTIAREAAKAMEGQRQVGVDAIYVPNHFEVRLHPEDHERIQPVQHTARRDAVRYLQRTAERRGFTFPGPVEVVLVADAAVPRGSLAVRAAFREAEAAPEDDATRRCGAPVNREDDAEEATRLFPAPRDRAGDRAAGWLEIREEDGAERRFALVPSRTYLIGRSEECDVQLADLRVSRRHARLVYEDGSWWIEDLQTTNGTRKNGALVRRERLRDGDELVMGRVVMHFVERSSRL